MLLQVDTLGAYSFQEWHLSMRRLFFVLLFLFFPILVNGQGLGVSPSKLSLEIYRGETAETEFFVVNPTDHNLEFSVSVQDNQNWFEFSPSQASLEPGETTQIKASVHPTEQAANGEYNTLINVQGLNGQQLSGLSFNIGMAIKTKIILSGKQTIHAQVNEIVLEDIEQTKPLVIKVYISNYGNVRIKPVLRCAISRNNRTVDRFDVELDEVLPNTRQKLTTTRENNFELGNYSAFVQLEVSNRIVAEKDGLFNVVPFVSYPLIEDNQQKPASLDSSDQKEANVLVGLLLVVFIIGLGVGSYLVLQKNFIDSKTGF